MVRAMFPVPMMLMLLMCVLSSLFSSFRFVSFVPGQAQRVGCDVLGQLLLVRYPGIPAYRL
jgi:hypothetical protein